MTKALVKDAAVELQGIGAYRPAEAADGDINALFKYAMDKGASLKELVELRLTLEARAAQRAFIQAFALFQAECPYITKDKQTDVATQSGAGYGFKWASFEHMVKVMRPELAKYGFSFGFDTKMEGLYLVETMWLRHTAGHEDRASFPIPTGSKSAMSEQQRFSAANTFAKRVVFANMLGLALDSEEDPEGEVASGPITKEQEAYINKQLGVLRIRPESVLKYFGIEKLADLPASRMQEVENVFRQRSKQTAPTMRG